jgi:hypothetical protein
MIVDINGYLFIATTGKGSGAGQTIMFFTVSTWFEKHHSELMYAFIEAVSSGDEANARKVIEGAKAHNALASKLSVIGIESLKPEHKDVHGITYLAPDDDELKDLPAHIDIVTDKIAPAIRGFSANLTVHTHKGTAFAQVPFLGTPSGPKTVRGTFAMLPTTDIDRVKTELNKLKKRGQFF